MNFNELEISPLAIEFFRDNQGYMQDLESCNRFLKKSCGIGAFFESTEQLDRFNAVIAKRENRVEEPGRRGYGDFQTNQNLALKTIRYILAKRDQKDFDLVIEPTCGKGSFILAALSELPTLRKITGVEIYRPYVWETKFKILAYFIQYKERAKPEIEIIHANVFDFDFEKLSKDTKNLKTLVVGTPPLGDQR